MDKQTPRNSLLCQILRMIRLFKAISFTQTVIILGIIEKYHDNDDIEHHTSLSGF